MATIESYSLADGSKRYRVRYRTPERRQTDKRGFKTKHEAADFAASVEVAKLQGLYVQPSHGKVLTGPWVVDWLAGRGDLARSSQVRYEASSTSTSCPAGARSLWPTSGTSTSSGGAPS